MLVNIALVSLGSPESRITPTTSATTALTPPPASTPCAVVSRGVPDGLMLIATSMSSALHGCVDRNSQAVRGTMCTGERHATGAGDDAQREGAVRTAARTDHHSPLDPQSPGHVL